MPLQMTTTAKDLFKPKRYKVLYGGRGGSKSHDVAGALLTLGCQNKMLILCAREVQKSIAQSVHRLLKNKISSDAALSSFYTVQENKIVGGNGTEFHFLGLKHNVDSVRSYEAVDICWVEEAANVSDNSWEVLIPTIRKPNSEIWLTFNPRFATDPTWVRFVEQADENVFVRKVSWRDNPWFPDVLDLERRKLEKNDPVAYRHIWEGEFDERYQGAVYAEMIKAAREQNRIARAPYVPGAPVYTAWDLGNADSTSIWFAQKVGLEVRVIDFYENNFKPLSHYADIIHNKPYASFKHFLPHDSKHERLGMRGSIKDQLAEMGIHAEEPLPPISDEAGIEMGRKLLSHCFIDNVECKDGIHALMHFQYEYDDVRQCFKNKPRADWTNHAADAWKYLAYALNIDVAKPKPIAEGAGYHRGSDGWMA